MADATVPTLTALDLELICAGLPGIDLAEWRAHTVWICKGARLGPHEYIMLREIFFNVLSTFDLDERARVLSFACGSGRLPASGFKALNPPFLVEVMPSQDESHLPQSHTCFNCICLPPFESEEVLAERLRRAIAPDAAMGFGFV